MPNQLLQTLHLSHMLLKLLKCLHFIIHHEDHLQLQFLKIWKPFLPVMIHSSSGSIAAGKQSDHGKNARKG